MNQREIFEQAYVDLADSIYRYIFFRVFDKDIAKDLTQETFFKVWDYIAKDKEIENMKAFIYRTAHNIVVNSIRNKKPVISFEELEAITGIEIADTQQEETKLQNENIASILESFKILSDQDAEIMRLRYVDGLSITEISTITSASENSLSVRIHRLLEKLKKYHSQT